MMPESLATVDAMLTTGESSRTALTAAAARAAHLVVDAAPTIFADTLAAPLLGAQAEELLGYHRARGDHPVLVEARAQTVCRARYCEDRLAEAVRDGVRQYVVLGAGLDTFAYRRPLPEPVHVFEVDHPATQRAKRARLSAAGIPQPAGVTYLPVDFAAGELAGQLSAAGLRTDRPAVVSWLGVTMYLHTGAVAATLRALALLAPGTEIVLDYLLPAPLRDAAGQNYVDLVAPVAAEQGEPWLSFFAPDSMAALLASLGLQTVEQVCPRDMVDPALWRRSDALRPAALSRVVRARVPAR
jgi:methyltransferase (TIGR00027 family)